MKPDHYVSSERVCQSAGAMRRESGQFQSLLLLVRNPWKNVLLSYSGINSCGSNLHRGHTMQQLQSEDLSTLFQPKPHCRHSHSPQDCQISNEKSRSCEKTDEVVYPTTRAKMLQLRSAGSTKMQFVTTSEPPSQQPSMITKMRQLKSFN